MDLRKISREELQEWLEDLRSRRKRGYAATPRKSSSRTPIHPSLEGVDEKIAEKILDELLAEGD